MAGFTEYQWLTQAKEDKQWTNYFTVLYPPPVEYEKIQNDSKNIVETHKTLDIDKKTYSGSGVLLIDISNSVLDVLVC